MEIFWKGLYPTQQSVGKVWQQVIIGEHIRCRVTRKRSNVTLKITTQVVFLNDLPIVTIKQD